MRCEVSRVSLSHHQGGVFHTAQQVKLCCQTRARDLAHIAEWARADQWRWQTNTSVTSKDEEASTGAREVKPGVRRHILLNGTGRIFIEAEWRRVSLVWFNNFTYVVT